MVKKIYRATNMQKCLSLSKTKLNEITTESKKGSYWNFVGKVGKGYATFRINSLEGLYFAALSEESNLQKEPKCSNKNKTKYQINPGTTW